MRNDVKYIKRNVKGSNAANWSLVIDVFLVLLAFTLDRTIGDNNTVNTIWIIISICGVSIPFIFFMIETISKKSYEMISQRVLNTKELVELFDDEICYMIMSAESFNKNIKEIKKIDSRQSALFLEFYVIEASYYLNKATRLILKMDNNLTSVLDEDDISQNHISKERIVNAISLISSIYCDLIEYVKKETKNLNNYSVHMNMKETEECFHSLEDFAKRKKDLLER